MSVVLYNPLEMLFYLKALGDCCSPEDTPPLSEIPPENLLPGDGVFFKIRVVIILTFLFFILTFRTEREKRISVLRRRVLCVCSTFETLSEKKAFWR